MKRLLTAFIFTAFLPFSFFAETIEGSVVVGAKDELPEGLFVKARGYLPGDIITLTNSYDGEKIQLLNLGTLDDDSEAAIVLSRESAEKLGITPGTKSPVTLETRSGSFDQRASGRALVTKTSAPKKEAAPVESYPEENSGDEFYGSFEESKNAVETPSPLDEKTDSTVQKEESASQKEKEVPAEKEAEPAAPSLEEEVEYEKFDADELPEDNEPKAEEPSKEDTQEEPSVSEQVEAEPENNEAASDTPEENEEPAASEEPDYEAFNPDELAEIEDETPPSEAPVSEEPAEEEPSPEDTAQEVVVPEEPDEGEQFTPDELSAIEEKPEEAVPEEQLPVEENLPPENDLEGERVDSNEPVVSDDGELFADDVEPVTEEVKPVEEKVTEDLPGEKVENVIPAENEAAPEKDLDGEEVISVEPVVPVKEEPAAEDLPGELVTNEDPVYEVPSDDEPSDDEPVADFTYLPAENEGVPASDLEGEDVASKEPERIPCADMKGEEVLSVEPKPVPLPDSEGEKVENKEPVKELPDNAYEGIVLVPAEPLPPENEPEPVEAEEVPFELEPVPEDLPGEKVKEAAPAEQLAFDQTEAPAEDLLSKYITEESELKKGAFYIQVAAFSKKENAEALIKKYPRYPYAIIITKTGSYKILAGPLNEDEYGAVFERFKSYGFKDAFVKKIK